MRVNPLNFTDLSSERGSDIVRYMDKTSSDVQDIREIIIAEQNRRLDPYRASPYWEDRVFLTATTFKDSDSESAWRHISSGYYDRNGMMRF